MLFVAMIYMADECKYSVPITVKVGITIECYEAGQRRQCKCDGGAGCNIREQLAKDMDEILDEIANSSKIESAPTPEYADGGGVTEELTLH